MTSMRLHLAALAAFLLVLGGAAIGHAQGAKTFVTLPFEVNGPEKYAHLRQGVQSMLTSRLTTPDRFTPLDRDKTADLKGAPKSQAQAKEMLTKAGADYLIWGSVTIVGEDASLDVQTLDREGKSWPKSAKTRLAEMIPALERLAKEMNAEIFKRPETGAARTEQKQAAGAMNPAFIPAETGARDYVLNPEIVYEGGADSAGRWRSQSFPWAGLGMVVGDVNGDRKNEIVILSEKAILVYAFTPQGLKELGQAEFPKTLQPIKVNLFDIDRDGTPEIIFSAVRDMEPHSIVYKFVGNQFATVFERLTFYMNVVKTPPTYSPVLVGQRKGRAKLFDNNDVREVVRMEGGRLELGPSLNLPDHSNLYNIAFLPDGSDHKTLIVDSSDNIRVHSSENRLLATTDEKYGGSSVSIEWLSNKPGTGYNPNDKFAIEENYYVPTRLIPADLERDGKYELIVNRNISVASQIFERYRSFPQGEIHALFWDGVGLQLLWKTRTIKGSVADYCLADMDGDSNQDLCVLVNSHPGAIGAGSRRATVLNYSLETDTVRKTPDSAKPANP